MGKRIIQQARGHGSLTYRVRRKAFSHKIAYPKLGTEEKGKIVKLISSAGHTAPIAKIQIKVGTFYNTAFEGAYEGQEVEIGKGKEEIGNILPLKDIKLGTQIYNIETRPGNGGKLIRSAGSSATVSKESHGKIFVMLPSKKEIRLDEKCRATIGVAAGAGRLDKPLLKAGRRHHYMKAKGRIWHFTSAVKMNALDHPFGSGRGKRIKSKIAKRKCSSWKKSRAYQT